MSSPAVGWVGGWLWVAFALLAGWPEQLSRARMHRNGKNTSLQQVGYEWIGQDDGWQECKTPPPPCTAPRGGLQKCGPHKGTGGFHDESGAPQLDMKKYPSLHSAVAYAHSHGLKADWYFNNCYCADPARAEKYFQGDASAPFGRHFMPQRIILPRQAQDKCRKS
jgi:hypothetical protein